MLSSLLLWNINGDITIIKIVEFTIFPRHLPRPPPPPPLRHFPSRYLCNIPPTHSLKIQYCEIAVYGEAAKPRETANILSQLLITKEEFNDVIFTDETSIKIKRNATMTKHFMFSIIEK